MTEIERLQSIIIVKALYALNNIQRTTGKYKDKQRALNRIRKTCNRTLNEIELLRETIGVKVAKAEHLKVIEM